MMGTKDRQALMGGEVMTLVADPEVERVVPPPDTRTKPTVDGATAAEIDHVLGFPADGLHVAFNAITHDIMTTVGRPQGLGSQCRCR